MLETGGVKIHRKITQWEWYKTIPTRVLFEHLIITANWRDGAFRGERVKRGSRVCSLDTLAHETGLSHQQVRTAISNLLLTGEITRRKTSKYTVISITNYDDYQTPNTKNNTETTEEQQENEHENNTQSTGKTTREQQAINRQSTGNQHGDNKAIKQYSNKDIYISAPGKLAQTDTPQKAPVICLPLNDKTEYPITEEAVREWARLYPAVAVIQQLRAMKGWLDANPRRRKTKSGILRFVNSWLAREQDKGRPAGKQEAQAVNSTYDVDEFFKAAVAAGRQKQKAGEPAERSEP